MWFHVGQSAGNSGDNKPVYQIFISYFRGCSFNRVPWCNLRWEVAHMWSMRFYIDLYFQKDLVHS